MLFLSLLFCYHARLFVDALWSPAGKGLSGADNHLHTVGLASIRFLFNKWHLMLEIVSFTVI